jgi:uncharacterized protein YciI
MKIRFALLGFLWLSLTLSAQKQNPNYDENLAKTLGADDYGMTNYVLVILKTGPNKSEDQKVRQKAFQGHMTNMNVMVEKGKLIVAGPLENNDKDYRGIFILKTETIEEAQLLLQTDPAIKAGYLEPEFFQWYGSAALPEYLPISDKIWKIGF